MVWLKIGPQNGATIVTRMTNVAILKYLEMTWNDTLILSHCHLHPFIVSAISQQLIHSPWSLCAEGTEEPHLDPGCYPAMWPSRRQIPVLRKFDTQKAKRFAGDASPYVFYRFLFPLSLQVFWNRPKCLCGLLQENANFYVLRKPWQPSISSTFFNYISHPLSPNHLHVSPCISPWPTLALILKRPRGSTTTSSRTCEAKQRQQIEQELQIHNKLNLSIVESVHLSEVLVWFWFILFASPNYHDMQHVPMCTANLRCWWLHIWQFLSRLHLRGNGQRFQTCCIIQHDNWQHTTTYWHKKTVWFCQIKMTVKP